MKNKLDGFLKIANLFALFFTIVFISTYYYVCFYSAINFPFGDDIYQTTLWFHSFYNANDYFEQFKHYFMQFNSHFLLFNYLASIIDYHIFGYLNYRHLIIIGNILLFGVWFLLFSQFREKNKPNFLLFLPVTLVLFIPVDKMINWAATAPHCGSMILLGMISLNTFSKQTMGWMLVSIVCMFLSMFSLVGGLAVPVAGFLMFMFLPNKSYKLLGIWIIASLVSYALFFSLWVNLVAGKHETEYLNALLLFFSFLGSAGTIESQFRIMAPLVGLIPSFILVYILFRTDYFKRRPGILGALFFMAGIAALTALGRNYLGPEVAIKNKYYWMQAVFLACFFISFLNIPMLKIMKRQYIALLLLLFLMIPVTISTYKKEIRKIKRTKSKNVYMVNNYNRELNRGDYGVYHAANIQIIVNRAVRQGYLQLPDFYEGRPVEIQ